MLARLGIHGIPVWVGVKLVIWLALGAAVVVAYKKPALGKLLWVGVPALVILAVMTGLTHLGQ